MGAQAILTILKNGETIKSQAVEGEMMLGRGEGCLIRLEDRAISRHHAVFRNTSDGVQVEKKSDFAPLLVNGSDCTSALMKEGDVVSIGPYLLRLSMLATPSAVEQPAPQPVALALVPNPASAPFQIEPSAPEAKNPAMGELEIEGILAPDSSDADNAQSGGLFDLGSPDQGSPSPNGDTFELAPSEDGITQVGLDPGGDADRTRAVPKQAENLVDDDGATEAGPAGRIKAVLMFAADTANVTEYEINQDQVSVGRDAGCDIVLKDKKASRKHALVVRAGARYILRDLESANGTFVNDHKITEHELSSDDRVRIGGVSFDFKALSADYAEGEKEFLAVAELAESEPDLLEASDVVLTDDQPLFNLVSSPEPALAPSAASPHSFEGTQPIPGMQGVPGLEPLTGIDPSPKPKTFLGRGIGWFRKQPPKRQAIVGAIFLAAAYLFIDDDEPQPVHLKKKPAAHASAVPGAPAVTGQPSAPNPTFEGLSASDQAYVKAQHQLGYDYFKNKEYDKAIFELEKIFRLVPDYLNTQEIFRYAKEAQVQQKSFEEENRKKAEEAKQKAQLEQLVQEIRELMTKKSYVQARELFAQIVALDPENSQVSTWKREIEDYEETLRRQEEIRMVQKEKSRFAWELYKSALKLKAKRSFYPAIAIFKKVLAVEALDQRPKAKSKEMIAACLRAITELRDPLLQKAKQLEDSQAFAEAFQTYKLATEIDPHHPAGYSGMDRIRHILHDRAKMTYTEAVLAESYSDFDTAKKKFKETLRISPDDDLYHERAQRKLSHYQITKEEEPPQ